MEKNKAYREGKSTGIFSVVMRIKDVDYNLFFSSKAVYLERYETSGDRRVIRYKVEKDTCSCPAFSTYTGPCKHILSLRKLNEVLSLRLKQDEEA